MQVRVDALQVRQCHMLAEDHLVDTRHEVRVEESAMEDGQPQDTTDELEVAQMVRVDPGSGVDLQRVVVVSRVLEQPVARIEDLVRDEEEPFSG